MLFPNKKDENITEYILYMWQTEDIIRSCNFDIGIISERLISTMNIGKKEKNELKRWYATLIEEMEKNNSKKKGHLEEINYLINELTYLHNTLITIFQDNKYIDLYNEATPNIREMQKRSGGTPRNDVETCLIGIYGIVLLKLQKKTVSKNTLDAVRTFIVLMNYLADKYKDMKIGKLDLPTARRN